MKPRDLPPPMTRRTRRVVFNDDGFFVPSGLQESDYVTAPSPCWQKIFPGCPISVEVGSGNGDWIVEKAHLEPQKGWIAIEKRFDRCRKIWAKKKNLGLSNLFIICGDASIVMQRYFPADCIDRFFINFPDPWPKMRHAKNRIVCQTFLHQMQRVMKRGGIVMLVTDDTAYLQQMVQTFAKSSFFPCFPPPFYVLDYPQYGSSFFEKLWRQKGRNIHYLQYAL